MYDLGVVIPVRRGSSRIKNKSMLPFGRSDSLIEWKLKQLCQILDPKQIYLSSEDEEFREIATSFGVSTHARDTYLAKGHDAPFRDVITGIVKDIPHEHIAWCTVVCPLMSPGEYLNSFKMYQEKVLEGDCDSLVGVNLTKEYFWTDEGALNYRADRNHTISQNLPNYYKVTNSVYMYNKKDILDREYFLGDRPYLMQLHKFAGVDIDYIEDYHMAKALYYIYLEEGMDKIDDELKQLI